MVYTVIRGEAVHISMDFDRLMRDEDQYQFFIPKTNWSVLVTEVNGRSDYSISNETTPYIIAVRNWQQTQSGQHLHDMKKMKFTLHGTGLFHFKVELGEFESFGEVSGYFMVFTIHTKVDNFCDQSLDTFLSVCFNFSCTRMSGSR